MICYIIGETKGSDAQMVTQDPADAITFRGIASKTTRWVAHNWVWVILVLALLVRLAAIIWIDLSTDALVIAFPHAGIPSPSGEFADLARNLLAGRGFSLFVVQGRLLPSAYMPPAYAYFLAGIFFLFGDNAVGYVVVQLLNVLLGALLCVVVAQMGRSLFGKLVGVLAGILTAGFPTLVFVVTQAHPVTMYVLLNCTLLLLLLSARPESRLRTGLLAGILSGILALFRPDTIAYLPVILLWLILTTPKIRSGVRNAILFISCFLLVVLPWTVRNYQVFGRLIPITSPGGFNLWRGQNEMTTGSGRGPGSGWVTPEIQSKIDKLPPTDDWEIRRDNIYREAALRSIRENPQRSLELVPRKLFYYWILNAGDSRTREPIYWLPWFLLIPFFLVGLVASARYGPGHWLLWGCLLVASGLASIFVVLSRYRLFTDPLVLILAALGLCIVFRELKARWQGCPLDLRKVMG